MEVNEALTFLQLTPNADTDAIVDRCEEICFEIKDYALRNTVVPQLFQQRIRRLLKVAQAKSTLLQHSQPTVTTPTIPFATMPVSLTEHLRWYEKWGAALKLKLANAQNEVELIAQMEALVQLQEHYQQGYYTHFQAVLDAVEAQEVKISEQQDSGVLIQAIQQLELMGVAVNHKLNGAIDWESTGAAQQYLVPLLTEAHRIHKWMQLQGN